MNKFALISVSDKTGITEIAKAIADNDYRIIATGRTAKIISEAGIKVTEVSSVTSFPEIFNGRVKTLHPVISGGILMRRDNKDDLIEAEQNNIHPIDIVCVNLYPFKEVTKNSSTDLDTAVENIDIGGPSLIRAAAKNYKYVSVLTNPSQYGNFIEELNNGEISDDTRKKLAVAAFTHTADYDVYISNYLEEKLSAEKSHFQVSYPLAKKLRYGENPHQHAEIYGGFYDYFDLLHGKELSYNNILDLVSAIEINEEHSGRIACTIVKHNNPAGVASGNNLLDAYNRALKCDPVSAFGGIVALNQIVDKDLANKLNEIFLEVVCAPGFTDDALSVLKKKKNRRLLKQLKSLNDNSVTYKNLPGGIIKQDADKIDFLEEKLQFVTNKKPTDKEMEDLIFAWKVAKHTKSNAIVFAKDSATLGVGAGQMSRIDSVKIAKMKAIEHKLDLQNSVAASDAFFPFADGLLEIVNCGAVSVIQPGGSVRDQEVIDAANEKNISMVFTGIRHFKH